MKIVAAIPAYNEELAIGSVVLKVKRYVDEVVVVDDGSLDNTAQVAELAGAKVVKHEKNQGYGAAIQTCFKVARELGCDILVTLDGDGQHDPGEIPLLIRPVLEEGVDMVIGCRRNSANTPKYRKVGQTVLNFATRLASKSSVRDSQSGFRAFSRKAFELKTADNSFAATSAILVDAAEKGLKIKEVPISCRYGIGGSTFNPLIHGIGVLSRIVEIIAQRRPLFFFGIAGLIFFAAALLVGWRVLTVYQSRGQIPTGETFITVLLVILAAISLNTALTLHAIQGMVERRSGAQRSEK